MLSLDSWEGAPAYEAYVGRWSQHLAPEFVRWLQVGEGVKWLDIGCGTGALTSAIITIASARAVIGIDRSAQYIKFAQIQIPDPRASFETGNAMQLDLEFDAYDVVVSGLVLNFLPNPAQGVQKMIRGTRDGGVVAAYVWDYAGKMQFMRHFWDAASALDPAARELDEGRRFPLCEPASLRSLFEEAGLTEIEVRDIVIKTEFKDFEDYWQPFLGGQGPAPGYVASLVEERREALKEHLRSSLPYAEDGTIPLTARAWAIRGTVIRDAV